MKIFIASFFVLISSSHVRADESNTVAQMPPPVACEDCNRGFINNAFDMIRSMRDYLYFGFAYDRLMEDVGQTHKKNPELDCSQLPLVRAKVFLKDAASDYQILEFRSPPRIPFVARTDTGTSWCSDEPIHPHCPLPDQNISYTLKGYNQGAKSEPIEVMEGSIQRYQTLILKKSEGWVTGAPFNVEPLRYQVSLLDWCANESRCCEKLKSSE